MPLLIHWMWSGKREVPSVAEFEPQQLKRWRGFSGMGGLWEEQGLERRGDRDIDFRHSRLKMTKTSKSPGKNVKEDIGYVR